MADPKHPVGLPDRLRLDRTLVMGVLNVTPDSFSDGGLWADEDDAVAHGLALAAAGADIVDVGGESTRPGAERITTGVEVARILPVVAGLAEAGVCVSIDTMRSATAARALAAGAMVVNDVSGGLADPEMLPMMSSHAGPYVIMHWRAHSAEMDKWAKYDDVVSEVRSELEQRVADAEAAGIEQGRLVLDPGLGFAKDAPHNWELLRALPELWSLGFPLLLGASRKRFLGLLLADESGPRPIGERDSATHAITALAAASGAWCVRVHDVAASADAVRVARAWTS